MEAAYVFVAGIGNCEPEHWQARWYARTESGTWVDHDDWDNPVRDAWVKDLDESLRAIKGPKILIAHSLGCTAIAEWASEHEVGGIKGAFLVAPPDVRGSNFPAAAVGFDAAQRPRLPFPALVVASEDDHYGSVGHASDFADGIGARMVNVGRKGHINTESRLGGWPEGWALFSDQFLT